MCMDCTSRAAAGNTGCCRARRCARLFMNGHVALLFCTRFLQITRHWKDRSALIPSMPVLWPWTHRSALGIEVLRVAARGQLPLFCMHRIYACCSLFSAFSYVPLDSPHCASLNDVSFEWGFGGRCTENTR